MRSSLGGAGERFRAKALCSGAGGGDARGYHVLLGDTTMVPLAKPGLRVKTLDRTLGLDGVDAARRLPPEDVVLELKFPSAHRAGIGGHFQILASGLLDSGVAVAFASVSSTRFLVGATPGPRCALACSGSTIRSGRTGGPLRRQLGVSGGTRSGGYPWWLVVFLVSSLGCFVVGCGFSCISCFSLMCFVRGSPHHLVSVWLWCFIYKAGWKPFSIIIR